MINEDIVLNVFLETARKIDIDLSLEALKKIYQIDHFGGRDAECVEDRLLEQKLLLVQHAISAIPQFPKCVMLGSSRLLGSLES